MGGVDMDMDTLLNKMECIHAVADVLLPMLEDNPKAQALVSVIMDYSNINGGE